MHPQVYTLLLLNLMLEHYLQNDNQKIYVLLSAPTVNSSETSHREKEQGHICQGFMPGGAPMGA